MARSMTSFDNATFGFLGELAANNEREWFAANKHRYESCVLEPALRFIERMGPLIEKISPHFTAIPKRTGGSLMRVYRDTRFSRDKTPYKTNIGMQFRHERGQDVHAPGFYVHIEPGSCFLGAGIWHPDSDSLRRIREHIAENGDGWRRATRTKRFTDVLALGGDALTRPPRGFDPDSDWIEDIKRKDFIAVSDLPDDEALASGFPAGVAERFRRARPLMAFLCESLGLAF
jgi:uncharacterized protein (TIGR02453 family)